MANGLDSERFLRDVYMVNAGISGEPETMAALRGEFPPDTGLGAIVQPSSYADQTALGAHLDSLNQGGIDGFAFYNYGLLRRTHLEWIGAHRHAWS